MATTTALQTQSNGKRSIRDILRSPAMLKEIGMALPQHVKPERMVRVATTAITRTPKLSECEEASFFKCLFDLSQWGLEPDGYHAHLIPFRNNKRQVTECQLIIDYKGYVKLAFQSGQVQAIHADVVRTGDLFDYDRGIVNKHTPHFLRTDPHKPDNAGKVIAAYCYVRLKDGAEKAEVLSRDDIENIRQRSKAKNDGPWVTDWNEMAKKTAFRRVRKWLPLSAELQEAMSRDEEFESLRSEMISTQEAVGMEGLRNRLSASVAPPEPDEAYQPAPDEDIDPVPADDDVSQAPVDESAIYKHFRSTIAAQKDAKGRKAALDDARQQCTPEQMLGLEAFADELANAK